MPRRPNPIAMPVQGRTADQDSPGRTRYACSKCDITYYVKSGPKPKCPVCEAQRRILELRNTMAAMRNQIEQLEGVNRRMAASLDLVTAMRDAVPLIGPDDLIFLKSVLYRYRAEASSIHLRITHGAAKRKSGRPPANGFLAVLRGGDPEAHTCTSIGGVAIAGYYEEALRASGVPTAMATIMRALNRTLSAAAERTARV